MRTSHDSNPVGTHRNASAMLLFDDTSAPIHSWARIWPATPSDGTDFVSVEGEICAETVSLLANPLLAWLGLTGATQIQLNLGRVSFIDARGLSLLLSLRAFAFDHQLDLDFERPSGPVQKIFSICGLQPALDGVHTATGTSAIIR